MPDTYYNNEELQRHLKNYHDKMPLFIKTDSGLTFRITGCFCSFLPDVGHEVLNVWANEIKEI